MQHIWEKIDELRAQYALLEEQRTPIDVFTFFEVDLGLDAIPFDDFTAKYRVEAAIKADFTGIYLDAEQYSLMRCQFAETVAPRFGVNAQVIELRLDRDGIWPAA